MRITINEATIKEAIVGYIEDQGFNLTGKHVEIDLKATRGPEGYSAEIDITNGNTAAATQPAVLNSKPLEIEKKVSAARNQEAAEEVTEEPAEETEDAPAPEETPSEKPKSIFGNLKKPVNSKEPADA